MKESSDLVLCLKSENKQGKCILVVCKWFRVGCSAIRKPSTGLEEMSWLQHEIYANAQDYEVRAWCQGTLHFLASSSLEACSHSESRFHRLSKTLALICNISYSTFSSFKICGMDVMLSSLIILWKPAFRLEFIHCF